MEHLAPTARDIESLGVRAIALAADVRDAGAVDAVVGETVARFGRLDILVNGAAGNFFCAAAQLSPNGFGAVVDIDLKGTFHACRAALGHLQASRGVVLNISATLHYGGTERQLHVSAAKAGVDALTRNLAVEWGPYGIRVVGIAPGPIADTEGMARLLSGDRGAAHQRTTQGRAARKCAASHKTRCDAPVLIARSTPCFTGRSEVYRGRRTLIGAPCSR